MLSPLPHAGLLKWKFRHQIFWNTNSRFIFITLYHLWSNYTISHSSKFVVLQGDWSIFKELAISFVSFDVPVPRLVHFYESRILTGSFLCTNQNAGFIKMIQSSILAKTPHFSRKYQTSPIPNIIDQLVFINSNTCCSSCNIIQSSDLAKTPHFSLSIAFYIENVLLTFANTQTFFFSYDPPFSRGNIYIDI